MSDETQEVQPEVAVPTSPPIDVVAPAQVVGTVRVIHSSIFSDERNAKLGGKTQGFSIRLDGSPRPKGSIAPPNPNNK